MMDQELTTLEGQHNFNTEPINYDLSQLFAALRVPKSFLNYDETTGEGKNLAMQDIRFARTVARIQQAALQELNKIAMIHLVARGLEEEAANFQLGLNNPSIQQELMRLELTQQRLTAYRDAVSDAGNGFSAMSMARAKKEILGMTNDEIILDTEQQRIEKAASFELEKTDEIIPDSGVFDKVDSIYGDPSYDPNDVSDDESEGGEGSDSLGGGSGGGLGGIGGGLDDLEGIEDTEGDEDVDLDTDDLDADLGGEDENPQEGRLSDRNNKDLIFENKITSIISKIDKVLVKK
jgi:hypothetical protein